MNEAAKMSKPVDFDELYPGRFLKAGELQGKKVTLTITAVDREVLEGDKGPRVKGYLTFAETDKQIVLNKTNGQCIRDMFGLRNPQQWVGHKITFFAGVHDGEPCIRVWGSPELTRDMQVIVALPRRKPVAMTMHAVRPNGRRQGGPVQQQQRAQPAPEPDAEHWSVPPEDDMDPEPSGAWDEHGETPDA